MLADDGMGELTLRELARRLGVTHAAPYAHFADKTALLQAVAGVGFQQLAAALAAARDGAPDPRSALAAMAVAYSGFARRSPHLYRLMFADESLADDPDCALDPEGERAFDQLVEAVVAFGITDPNAARAASLAMWASVHGLAMLELDRRIGGKMELGDDPQGATSEILLAGLTAQLRS